MKKNSIFIMFFIAIIFILWYYLYDFKKSENINNIDDYYSPNVIKITPDVWWKVNVK